MPIHIGQVVAAHIARSQWQKPRRTDIASVRYEHNAVAVTDAKAAIRGRLLDLGGRKPFGLHQREGDAPV